MWLYNTVQEMQLSGQSPILVAAVNHDGVHTVQSMDLALRTRQVAPGTNVCNTLVRTTQRSCVFVHVSDASFVSVSFRIVIQQIVLITSNRPFHGCARQIASQSPKNRCIQQPC